MRNPTLQGLPGPAARRVEHQSWEKLFQWAPFLSVVFKGFWWLSNRKESAKATLLLPQDCPLPSLHAVFSSVLPEVLPPEPLFLGTGLSSSYFCARGSGSGSSMYAPRAHHKLFDRKISMTRKQGSRFAHVSPLRTRSGQVLPAGIPCPWRWEMLCQGFSVFSPFYELSPCHHFLALCHAVRPTQAVTSSWHLSNVIFRCWWGRDWESSLPLSVCATGFTLIVMPPNPLSKNKERSTVWRPGSCIWRLIALWELDGCFSPWNQQSRPIKTCACVHAHACVHT